MNRSYKLHLLLIEDNKGDARLIKELLKEDNKITYFLEWRENLHDGMQILKDQDIDLLLLDLTLPDSSGLDTVRSIVSTFPSLPVVVLTGLNDDVAAFKAVGLGAQDYLIKGEVNARFLARSIVYAIERHNLIYARQNAEKALDESQRQVLLFAKWLEESSQPFAVGYPDGRFGLANNAYCRLVGYSQEELKEHTWAQITPPEYLDEETRLLAGLHHSKEPVHYEKEYIRKDGTRIPVALLVHSRSDERGQPDYYYAFVTDITERKRIEGELKARDIRLQKLTSQLPGMLYQFLRTPNGHYSVPYTSDSIRQIFGCSPDDVHDDFSPITRVIHPEDVKPLVDSIEDSAARLVLWKHEYRVQVPGQQIRWLLGFSMPEKLTNGSIIWHGYNVDITDRKQDEIELQFKSLLLDASIDAVFVHDESGNFYYVNEAACKAHGYSREELLAMNLHDLDTPSSAALIESRIEVMKRTGSATFESEHVHKDGTTMPFEVRAGFATIQGRQLVFSICRDITERKKADASLKRALADVKRERDKAKVYIDIAQTILVALDAEGRITLLNKLGAKILEIDQTEAMGISWFDNFIPSKDRIVIRAYHAEIMSGKAVMDELAHENLIITKNGRERIILWQNCPLLDDRGSITGTLSSGEDITERKQAEVMLRENEARLRLTLSTTGIGLFDIDLRTGKAIISPECATMLGYNTGELQPTIELWLGSIHPDDREAAAGTLQSCIAGKISEYQMEFRLLSKCGAWRWIRSIGRVVQYTSNFIPVRLLGIQIDISNEKNAEGSLKKALLDRETAQQDLLILNQELEHRVEDRTRELKNAQERMVRQEKLAIIGKLAGSVSHELRNPLGVISNSIYYLMTKFSSVDEKVKKHLNYIQEEVSRASKIVSDLLDFTRVQPDERVEVDLNGIIGTLLDQMKLPKGVKITKNFAPNIPTLKLDPRKMQQLFNNLITNAIQAMPNGGDLIIHTSSDAETIEIDFKDTGTGISPENQLKLFEPLFTTKQKGIGLGLTIVKDIVEGYKGTIQVESKVGAGTTFKIHLPLSRNISEPSVV